MRRVAQSLSASFSSRAPPASPTGISTQKRAAVPKISEAMATRVETATYLAAAGSLAVSLAELSSATAA